MLRWTGGYRRTGRGSVEEVSGAASCKVLGGASLEDTGTVRGCPREARIVTCKQGKEQLETTHDKCQNMENIPSLLDLYKKC